MNVVRILYMFVGTCVIGLLIPCDALAKRNPNPFEKQIQNKKAPTRTKTRKRARHRKRIRPSLSTHASQCANNTLLRSYAKKSSDDSNDSDWIKLKKSQRSLTSKSLFHLLAPKIDLTTSNWKTISQNSNFLHLDQITVLDSEESEEIYKTKIRVFPGSTPHIIFYREGICCCGSCIRDYTIYAVLSKGLQDVTDISFPKFPGEHQLCRIKHVYDYFFDLSSVDVILNVVSQYSLPMSTSDGKAYHLIFNPNTGRFYVVWKRSDMPTIIPAANQKMQQKNQSLVKQWTSHKKRVSKVFRRLNQKIKSNRKKEEHILLSFLNRHTGLSSFNPLISNVLSLMKFQFTDRYTVVRGEDDWENLSTFDSADEIKPYPFWDKKNKQFIVEEMIVPSENSDDHYSEMGDSEESDVDEELKEFDLSIQLVSTFKSKKFKLLRVAWKRMIKKIIAQEKKSIRQINAFIRQYANHRLGNPFVYESKQILEHHQTFQKMLQ